MDKPADDAFPIHNTRIYCCQLSGVPQSGNALLDGRRLFSTCGCILQPRSPGIKQKDQKKAVKHILWNSLVQYNVIKGKIVPIIGAFYV